MIKSSFLWRKCSTPLLFGKSILSPQSWTYFYLFIVCICNFGQAQAKWKWKNLNIPLGKICSVTLSVVFLLFGLLTTLSYFHHKNVFFFLSRRIIFIAWSKFILISLSYPLSLNKPFVKYTFKIMWAFLRAVFPLTEGFWKNFYP